MPTERIEQLMAMVAKQHRHPGAPDISPIEMLQETDSLVCKAFDAYGVDDEPTDGHRDRVISLFRAIDSIASELGCSEFRFDPKLRKGYPKAEAANPVQFWKWFPSLVERRQTIWQGINEATAQAA